MLEVDKFDCLIIEKYDDSILDFLCDYYKSCYIVINNKLESPKNDQVSYIRDMIGQIEVSDKNIDSYIDKLLPELDRLLHIRLVNLLQKVMEFFKEELGKNENALKSILLKYLCWLNYKFKYILNQDAKRLLYFSNELNIYDLIMFKILGYFECTSVILTNEIRTECNILDGVDIFKETGRKVYLNTYAENFINDVVKAKVLNKDRLQKAFGVLEEVQKTEVPKDINNLFSLNLNNYYGCIIENGVSDRTDYLYKLYDWQYRYNTNNLNGIHSLEPMANDINILRRSNDKDIIIKTNELANNFIEVCPRLRYAIYELYKRGYDENRVVRLVATLKRFDGKIFISSFILLVHDIRLLSEKNMVEDFKVFLELLGVNLIILNPSNMESIELKDSYVLNEEYSLGITKIPECSQDIQFSTVAYNAENDIKKVINETGNSNSGLDVVVLNTMYEEISMLWNEKPNMRTGYKVNPETGRVTFPVIFSKITGVENGKAGVNKYVDDLNVLARDEIEGIVINPYIYKNKEIKSYWGNSAVETGNIKHYELREYLMKSGSLNYDLLKERFSYQYLSETVQNRILEKINLLISMKLFKNVDDSDILTVGLNLNKTLLELLQCFNYNKPNPKIVYLGMTEDLVMIQDCILLHLLFLLGFDVLIFIPTGYDIFDRHMSKKLYCEHNIGDYVFDIKIGTKVKHRNLFSGLFRK